MPDFLLEKKNGGVVAGIDEAGRGPWAGPVFAAAVIFKTYKAPLAINDSKQLSAKARDTMYDYITAHTHWSVAQASVEEIDRLNILGATKLAMARACEGLGLQVGTALVDGNQPPALPCRTIAVIRGDSKSTSIAAASILAKVTRDRLMQQLAEEFPGYGWERNAGYGTKAHQHGLAQYGVTPHHRRSFAPIRALLEENAA